MRWQEMKLLFSHKQIYNLQPGPEYRFYEEVGVAGCNHFSASRSSRPCIPALFWNTIR